MPTSCYSLLEKAVSQLISIDNSDKELMRSLFETRSIDKNAVLIEEGNHVQEVFFVNSGYLKYSKITDAGDEQVIHLDAPGSFTTSLMGFFKGELAEETLQAITDCELLAISRENLDKLYNSGMQWQIFGRKLMEGFLVEKEQRIIEQLSLTGQQKYLKLMASHPEMIQNVPVKYLASFLGLQPESLSRIKNRAKSK